MKTFFSLLFLFIVLSTGVTAQTFEIAGQIRPRAEYRHGYRSLLADEVKPGFAISQRSRLMVNYTNKALKMGITFQDFRIWGDVPLSNKKDVNGTAIQQAWAEYKFCNVFSAKFGRQTLLYDDERLMGGSNWSQQSKSHDAAVLKFTASKATMLHVGLAYNQSEEKDTGNFYPVNNYKAMQFLWFHHDFKTLGISFMVINNGLAFIDNHEQKISFSQTFGPYLSFKKDKLKFNGAFYYQRGKNSKNVNLSAMYASAEAGYSIVNNVSLGGGFQYFTGNNQVHPDNSTDHSFSTLYGTAHKFNGWMDYFYAGSGHGNVGLFDLYLPCIYSHNKFTAEFQPHYFSAVAPVKDKTVNAAEMPAALGVEADFMASYNVTPEFNIQGGYSQMFGTETLQTLKGGNRENAQNWIWVMLTFNPTFFKSEK